MAEGLVQRLTQGNKREWKKETYREMPKGTLRNGKWSLHLHLLRKLYGKWQYRVEEMAYPFPFAPEDLLRYYRLKRKVKYLVSYDVMEIIQVHIVFSLSLTHSSSLRSSN